jgi:hypothetical protein
LADPETGRELIAIAQRRGRIRPWEVDLDNARLVWSGKTKQGRRIEALNPADRAKLFDVLHDMPGGGPMYAQFAAIHQQSLFLWSSHGRYALEVGFNPGADGNDWGEIIPAILNLLIKDLTLDDRQSLQRAVPSLFS